MYWFWAIVNQSVKTLVQSIALVWTHFKAQGYSIPLTAKAQTPYLGGASPPPHSQPTVPWQTPPGVPQGGIQHTSKYLDSTLCTSKEWVGAGGSNRATLLVLWFLRRYSTEPFSGAPSRLRGHDSQGHSVPGVHYLYPYNQPGWSRLLSLCLWVGEMPCHPPKGTSIPAWADYRVLMGPPCPYWRRTHKESNATNPTTSVL